MAYVKFEKTSLEDRSLSLEKGRTVYAEAVEATIVVDNKTTMKFVWPESGEIPNEIRLNYMEAYQAWLVGQESFEGTPLVYLPGMTPAQADNLKSYGIVSVEQLAEANAAQIGSIMGGVSLQSSARAYLENSSGGVSAGQAATLSMENELLRQELAELRERMEKREREEKGKK